MRVMAVPVKAPERSKSRLSALLSNAERAALTAALLHDVLDACLAQPDWSVWVVCPDPDLLSECGGRGARPVTETGSSLLEAVRQVESELGAAGDELAIVLGDLPWLTAPELHRALAAPGAVVAAPAYSDGGTNLLVRRPPGRIPARFGPASFARHRWEAERAGTTLVEVGGPGLERDLDRPVDLGRLVASDHPGRARAACLEMGLPARLLERVART